MRTRNLTTKQIDILRLLYRFRFATTDLLTQALETNGKHKMNERLKKLLDQKYIGRNFEPEYHLLRQHASYYLLPEGVKALKRIPDNNFDSSILHNIYKDKDASDQFIAYWLGIFSAYCQLKKLYGDDLRFFTKNQLVNKYEYFSEFTPSVYVRLKIDGIEKEFFLEYLQSSKPLVAAIQKINQYIAYSDSGEWETETNSDLPKVLLLCDKLSLQKRLVKRATSVLEDSDEELEFYITTSVRGNTWTNVEKPDELLSLDSI